MELGIPTKSSASNPEGFLGAGDDTCTHARRSFREAGRLLVCVPGGFVWQKQIASTVHTIQPLGLETFILQPCNNGFICPIKPVLNTIVRFVYHFQDEDDSHYNALHFDKFSMSLRNDFSCFQDKSCLSTFCPKSHSNDASLNVPWSKVAILGMVIPPLIGILIMGI